MAGLLKAVRAYGPRIDLNKTADPLEVVEYISERTGLNRGEIRLVLDELHDTVLWFNKRGIPVKLEGLGHYTPFMKVGGTIRIVHRLDSALRREINKEQVFKGVVINNENRTKTVEELVELWNTDHPDDLVVLP